MVKKIETIRVQGYPINVEDEYICITDMAKAGGDEKRAASIIQNWLRNKSTVDFLGTWEAINNPIFKVVEFEYFRECSGNQSFTLSVQQWVEKITTKLYLMKKLLLFILLLLWINGLRAQSKLQHSRAYIGGILQEGRFGGSLILSYGINQYLGLGAGVDITSYRATNNSKTKFFAPFYADLRFKYPAKIVEPFVFGQFGKQSYESNLGTYTWDFREQGKLFYGAGLGLSSKHRKKIGAFASVTYRLYKFKYDRKIDINGRVLEDREQSMLVISAGLVF